MAKIFARNVEGLYRNDNNGSVILCELYTTEAPDELPVNGTGIDGIDARDTFAAGCTLIATTAKKVWMVGEDEGNFDFIKEM